MVETKPDEIVGGLLGGVACLLAALLTNSQFGPDLEKGDDFAAYMSAALHNGFLNVWNRTIEDIAARNRGEAQECVVGSLDRANQECE